MLELLLCSLFTVFPDYLYRRYVMGKRLGHEITLFSVWYELRYGITACVMLTVALIAVIFYNHPTSTNVTVAFRAVPILPESGGRVAKIHVSLSDDVKKGDPIFSLDNSKQVAALEVAKRRIAEIDARLVMAQSDIATADGQILQAQGALKQAEDELRTKQELNQRNSGIVAQREIERLQTMVDGRKGVVDAALANKQAAETRISILLPAEKASAEAALQQAQVELDKTIVYAGIDGRIEQFVLKVGDFVSPLLRPAGLLIPAEAGKRGLVAGFNQIEGQVLKVGMSAEVTCMSRPWVIIPMVVTDVQNYIAAGQIRASEQLIDLQQVIKAGTITVFMYPMYEGGLEHVIPGSSCVANAYTNNHEELAREDIGFGTWIYLHIVDTVGIVHAILLRLQALLLPIKVLVLSGH